MRPAQSSAPIGAGTVALGATAWALIIGAGAGVSAMAWRATAPLRAQAPEAVAPMDKGAISAAREEFSKQLTASASGLRARSPFAPPKPVEPPKPRVPPKYAGPAVIGVVANQVYFADGKRISVGQEQGGVEVVSLAAPWTVKLRWSGGEYDVTLVERQPIRFDETGVLKDTLFKREPPRSN